MKNLVKSRFSCALLTCIIITLISTISYAEKRYIVDVLVVSLREGPATSFRSLKSLKTGHSFTVLDEQNKFIKIETSDGTIGWLPKQYTSPNPPKSILVERLSKKIETVSREKVSLEEKTAQLDKEMALKEQKINELENKYSLVKKTENADLVNLQQQLDTITKKHENLIKQSKSAIQTSKERDSLLKDNSSLQKKVESLEQENRSLANKQALYWFLAGGGVFILGWLIGRVSCRRQKSSLTL